MIDGTNILALSDDLEKEISADTFAARHKRRLAAKELRSQHEELNRAALSNIELAAKVRLLTEEIAYLRELCRLLTVEVEITAKFGRGVVLTDNSEKIKKLKNMLGL